MFEAYSHSNHEGLIAASCMEKEVRFGSSKADLTVPKSSFRFTPERRHHADGQHVRFVPCVDGSVLARTFFTSQAWSVLPCVRPLAAVHMTAGHNALRGSGPGQQHAFDDAMTLGGCPDRRIDRLCITCCSPSQPSPSHHAGVMRALNRPRRTRVRPVAERQALGTPSWRGINDRGTFQAAPRLSSTRPSMELLAGGRYACAITSLSNSLESVHVCVR